MVGLRMRKKIIGCFLNLFSCRRYQNPKKQFPQRVQMSRRAVLLAEKNKKNDRIFTS